MQHVNALFLTRLMEFKECRKVDLHGVNTLCCQFMMIYNPYEYHSLEHLLLRLRTKVVHFKDVFLNQDRYAKMR